MMLTALLFRSVIVRLFIGGEFRTHEISRINTRQKIVNCLFWKITPVSDKTCFVAVRGWPSRTVSIFSVMADSARQHSSGLIMEKFMTHQELKVMLLKDPAFRAAYEAESQNPQSGYQIIRHHGDGTEEVVFDSRVSGTDLPTATGWTGLIGEVRPFTYCWQTFDSDSFGETDDFESLSIVASWRPVSTIPARFCHPYQSKCA